MNPGRLWFMRVMFKIVSMHVLIFMLLVSTWSRCEENVQPRERVYEILKLQTGDSIELDGQLTESVWTKGNVAGDFITKIPREGQPATQKTEVRMVYDDKNIYIALQCWQSAKILVNDLHRDFMMLDNDGVEVIFDTFHDHRNGFNFIVSPMGSVTDLQFTGDGTEGNTSWNGVWEAKTRIYDDRWTAELVIPFKTLRFAKAEQQEWGVNFLRRARYISEESCWAFVPKRFYIGKVSLAGHLEGIEGVHPGRNLKIKPFIAGSATRLQVQSGNVDHYLGKIGLDLKYGVTSGMTLDFTANTDFSQVEADVQQINLTRFNLFFPEKREFFLENSTLFHVGEPLSYSGSSDVMMFYSRRIGLDADGNPIPLLGGVRLSGRMNKYEVGFLNMQSKELGTTPANNFTVARVRRSIFKSSSVGAMFVNRNSTSASHDYNRTFGIDMDLRFTRNLVLNAYLAKSQTPGKSGRDWAGGASVSFSGESYKWGAKYREVDPNFNAEVGYVRRTDIRLYSGTFAWLFHPKDFFRIREIRPSITGNNYLTTDNELDTRTIDLGLDIEFLNSSTFNFYREQSHENLARDFQPFPNRTIPIGDYRYSFYHVSYSHDNSRIIAPNIQFEKGDYYDGERIRWAGGLKFHPSARLSFTTSVQRDNVKISSGSYGLNLMIWRINYCFTTKMFLDALIQYNSLSGQVSSNIRFNLIHHPLSDLFVVYNETRDQRTGSLVGRMLSIKFTQLFDF
jgi:hypothetical protein